MKCKEKKFVILFCKTRRPVAMRLSIVALLAGMRTDSFTLVCNCISCTKVDADRRTMRTVSGFCCLCAKKTRTGSQHKKPVSSAKTVG